MQQQADVLTNYSSAAFAALAHPTDDTALKAALAAERNRILSIFASELECTEYERIDAIIRALGDGS